MNIAKTQAVRLFKTHIAAAQLRFRRHALRKYRCKSSQVVFDDEGAARRISEAGICYDDDSILGRTDGHSIEIACVDMTHPELVGTLIHDI